MYTSFDTVKDVLLTLAVALACLQAVTVQAAARDIDPHAVHEKDKIKEVVDVARDAMVGGKNFSNETTTSCLRAFGHEQFCECLGRKLPGSQSFDSYIFFTTMDPAERNHPAVSLSDRQLVTSAVGARDACVQNLGK